ncbi:xylose isomerase [Streptomyces qinglanensis]|uniref:Xylose isomerase n=1 Tax=Streptomyces qinglanensis TaxID=943816 RepID=A0A1E7K3L2_9ACTN|nr:sugar phosphate isomerase/epimerase [Streptomyces qinglanensis]OEU98499.1 xylose isomerase [Streptomyces qinglanensis]
MRVRIANAPVSYGIYRPDHPLPPDRLLAAFRDHGYRGTDSGPLGYLGEGEALAGRLARHGLSLAGGWADLRYGAEPAAFAADLRALDRALDAFTAVPVDDALFAPRPTLACPADPERFAAPGVPYGPDRLPVEGPDGPGRPDQGWEGFAADVQRAADRCRERGLEPVFHPHLGTAVETPAETRLLLSRTDVSLCLDTGHWWLAGGDPVAAVAEFGPRIRQVHLKDADRAVHERVRRAGGDLWAVVAAGGFPALGEGDIDLPAVLAALRAADYGGWLVVEQDAPPTDRNQEQDQDRDRSADHDRGREADPDQGALAAQQKANSALLRSLLRDPPPGGPHRTPPEPLRQERPHP